MAKQTINIGAYEFDLNADTIRDAFDKTNQNFSELYSTPYTPSNSADWDGTPPITVGEALDRLAAVVKTLNGGTGA